MSSCLHQTHTPFAKQQLHSGIAFIQDLTLFTTQSTTQSDSSQSKMDLLKTALLIVLLTTISAMPRGFRRHHDADIPELHAYHGFIGDPFNFKDSSESSESQSSSEENKSSEEIIIPDVTTPVVIMPAVTQPAVTSRAMTTVEEGSTATPEVDTIGTDQPIVMETTVSPETPTPSASVTTTCDQCFTVVISTGAPITDNRGDN